LEVVAIDGDWFGTSNSRGSGGLGTATDTDWQVTTVISMGPNVRPMADPPDRPSTDPDEAIMSATYRALREHGYADLTIKQIAAEYGKSTAAVHYHYDTKEDLLAAFLDYILDQFVQTIHEVETTDPERRLELLLDQLLLAPEDHYDLSVALLEMRSQAPYETAFAERFRQNDEYVRYMLRTVIDDGITAGVFTDVDAEHAASALMTIVDGARTRAVVLDDLDALATARQTADEYVSAVLREDG
jgi:AcrR family transcriptional regulator